MEIYNHPDFLAVLLVLGLPITAVILYYASVIHKHKKDNELRRLIIEKNIDVETAKILVGGKEHKKNEDTGVYNFKTLRRASVFLFAGLGAIIIKLTELDTDRVYFWLLISFFIGIGLLASFITEALLKRKS